MKKIILLTVILFISSVNFAQTDTTFTFTYDIIPYHIGVDTVIFESDMIVIDTMELTQEFYQDYKLMPWYMRDSIYINTQKFAKRYIQKGFKKYGTSHVIRFYRYRDVRYIKIPEKIKTKVIYN